MPCSPVCRNSANCAAFPSCSLRDPCFFEKLAEQVFEGHPPGDARKALAALVSIGVLAKPSTPGVFPLLPARYHLAASGVAGAAAAAVRRRPGALVGFPVRTECAGCARCGARLCPPRLPQLRRALHRGMGQRQGYPAAGPSTELRPRGSCCASATDRTALKPMKKSRKRQSETQPNTPSTRRQGNSPMVRAAASSRLTKRK